MYLPNTELTRREPKGDPLDVVKVIGTSPIKQSSVEDWVGAGGDHIIVQPAKEFGANEIMPFSIAQSEYEVTEYPPEDEYVDTSGRGRQTIANALSPEQQFAKEAREEGGKPTKTAKKDEAKPAAVTS